MASREPYSDHFSEDDIDDHANGPPRTSLEIAQADRQMLAEEDEQEELIINANQPHRIPTIARGLWDRWRNIGGRDASAQEYYDIPGTRRGVRDSSDMMYRNGDVDSRSSSPISTVSSNFEAEKARTLLDRKPKRRSCCSKCCLYFSINLLIVVAFVGIAIGAIKASHRKTSGSHGIGQYGISDLLFNGSSVFLPTTILISLDGFRADFLQDGRTPHLQSIIKRGVSPEYMLPSFPSVTFPNHFTLVTGLHPESHGVVGNTFWDPALQEEFYYTHTSQSMQPKWWQAEPIWETAEKHGIETAIHMWPGSEAHIGNIEPTYLDKYNGTEDLQIKAVRLLELLDLAGPSEGTADLKRPQLIAAYVPNVDMDGHLYGPNSTEILDTIKSVDDMLGIILQGLEERNLTEIVNVVVVSDHGMASTSIERLIQLETLIDTDKIEHIEGWPHFGLRPKNPDDLQDLYDQLKKESTLREGFDVYLKDRDMPERYHFSNNDRIAPLWIMPHANWAVVQKDEFDIALSRQEGLAFHPRGIHGYDNEHPLMRAIFMAQGPAFPHHGARLEPFQNTEVYNIVCDTLGIEPLPNNGTIRLPFKTSVSHPESATPETTQSPVNEPIPSISDIQPSAVTAAPSSKPSPESLSYPSEAESSDDSASNDQNKSLWGWMVDELQKAKEWAGKKIDETKEWATDLVNNDEHVDDIDFGAGTGS